MELGEGGTELWAPLFLTPPPPPASLSLLCSGSVLCCALRGERVGGRMVEEGLENGWKEEQEGGEAMEKGGERGRLREAVMSSLNESRVEDI